MTEQTDSAERTSSLFRHHAEMYRLPGDPPLIERDIQKYAGSSTKILEQFGEQAINGLSGKDGKVRLEAASHIALAPETEFLRLIEQGLNDKDEIGVRVRAAKSIALAPEADRARLIGQAFEDKYEIVRQGAIANIAGLSAVERIDLAPRLVQFIERDLMRTDSAISSVIADAIGLAPEGEQKRLQEMAAARLEKDFDSGYANIRSRALKMIGCVPLSERTRFIELGLQDRATRSEAILFISKAPEADRARLIEQALRSGDDNVIRKVAGIIDLAPEADRDQLRASLVGIIERQFGDTRENWRLGAIELIDLAPASERTRLLAQGMRDADSSLVRLGAAGRMSLAPETDRARLIGYALSDEDIRVRLKAVELIDLVPEADRAALQEGAAAIVEEGLNGDENVRKKAAALIARMPEGDIGRLRQVLVASVEGELRSENPRRREKALSLIGYLPEHERVRLLRENQDFTRLLQAEAGSTPLYRKHQGRFFRRSLVKTGATTLLDTVPGQPEKSLREQVIIRHIDVDPYLAWKKAYEAAEFWKNKGFDYVPVEPIVKASKKEGWNVDAHTRVLRGPSVHDWKLSRGMYSAEIDTAREKIIAALRELGVTHGHMHEQNFVIVFARDENGEVVLERPPRVYVIDFDQAVS